MLLIYLAGRYDPWYCETKLMVNFIVTMAARSYHPTKHPYRIVFLPTTRLRMCDALPSNLTGLDPVKYESIKDGSLNTDYLVGESYIIHYGCIC